MILYVDIPGRYSSFTVDLDDVYAFGHVIDEESFAEALTIELIKETLEAGETLSGGTDFSELRLLTVDDDDQNELSVDMPASPVFIMEVAQFAWHVLDESYDTEDQGKYFAYVDNVGWKWFDFDRMSVIDDNFMQTFDGDYEEYAKEYMENYGETLPEWAVDFFNFEEYGEELIDRETLLEWGYSKYVFTE